MRKALVIVAVLLGLAACTKDKATVNDISVADAQKKFAANEATPCDANDDEYRKAVGWVPGAVRLSNFATYALTELPQDKARSLVFYCTSRM